MRKEFEMLYIVNRRKGMSCDESYNAAYIEIKSRYDEATINRELEGK